MTPPFVQPYGILEDGERLEMTVMSRSKLLVAIALGAALAALLSGCGGGVKNQPIPEAGGAQGGFTTGGDAVAPAPVQGGERYLFRSDKPPVEVREVSRDAIGRLPKMEGLEYVPLASTEETVAVFMIEEAPDLPWNSLIDRAKLRLFADFAAHVGMGDWLILVTDVVVHGPGDPIHPNAYRWPRAEVQEYATCGIPDSGANDCTLAFFAAADEVTLAPMGGPPLGK
jgi:hypothetical protein